MIRHRLKAFRLAPKRLHDGMHLGRELAYFADQTLQRTRGGWAKDSHEIPWNARGAAGEQRETRTHDADSRQNGPNARQLNAAPEQTRLLPRDLMPVARRIE